MSLRRTLPESAVDLNMTAMIDIVFQLLIFFIMTLNIVTPEGDFNIKMPLSSSADMSYFEDWPQTLKLKLSAGPDGRLAALRLGDTPVRDFDEVRARILHTMQAAGGPGRANLEVELACDDRLHYDHVVQAITAVSGRIENGRLQQLVGQIKFAPPAP